MRGIYLSFEYKISEKDLFNSSHDGIVKKITSQIKSFKNERIDIDFYNPYVNKNYKVLRILRRLPFFFLNRWSKIPNSILTYDFIYIRKPWFMDGDLIRFIRRVKDKHPKIKILLEIPTYPYDKEAKKISIRMLSYKDKKWRKKLHLYIDRIVTYSRDNQIFGIESINIYNGIDIEKTSVIEPKNFYWNKNIIQLVACSSLYYWHGYDRLIKGMRDYYNGNNKYEIFLNIIGEGDQENNYKRMVENFGLSKYIRFYGKLSGEKLNRIYNISDIAVDSLGRHRSGVFYNSSLKSKEYLAKGLPIVSGVENELDYDKDFLFYCRVPANDDNINMNDIIRFYEKLAKFDKKSMTFEINKYAKDNFDYNKSFYPVIKYIKD